MKKNTDLNRISNLLIEAGTLKKIVRSHRQQLYTDDLSDNIASHTFRVSLIALILSELLHADTEKVLIMSLLHDLSEVRSGDQNWVQKRYVKVYDNRIRQDQLKGLLPNDKLFKITSEYEKRQSLESKITKDADNLEQLLLEKEYSSRGIVMAGKWMKSPTKITRLNTDIAKELALLLTDTPITSWWDDLWTDKRIK